DEAREKLVSQLRQSAAEGQADDAGALTKESEAEQPDSFARQFAALTSQWAESAGTNILSVWQHVSTVFTAADEDSDGVKTDWHAFSNALTAFATVVAAT